MREIHRSSHETYGRPRMQAELRDACWGVNHKRVARLMKLEGLEGASRRRKWRTTKRAKDVRPAPDLVERDFLVRGPDRLWVADVTYRAHLERVPVPGGGDGCLESAGGGPVDGDAPEDGAHARGAEHGDLAATARSGGPPQRPGQYTSTAFGLHCKEAGVRPSMASVGDAYDNAMCESFFATLECELIERKRLRSQAEAKMAVFDFIEGWYNPRHRHSALDYESPIHFERRSEAAFYSPAARGKLLTSHS